jgi:hypothetical protein
VPDSVIDQTSTIIAASIQLGFVVTQRKRMEMEKDDDVSSTHQTHFSWSINICQNHTIYLNP